MRYRFWFVIGSLVLILAATGVVSYYVSTIPHAMTIPEAERLAREQIDPLPMGSTKNEVGTWLDSERAYHVERVDNDGRLVSIWGEKTLFRGLLYNLELHMEFFFDQEGKLSKKWWRVVSVNL